jgi:hypothetical protein
MHTRITRNPALLTFGLNSQDRQCPEVQAAYKAEVIEPSQKEAHAQEGDASIMYFPPSRSALENGAHNACKKEKRMAKSSQERANEHHIQRNPRQHHQLIIQ